MSFFLPKFFHSKKTVARPFLNVTYLRHDPQTQTLILYNFQPTTANDVRLEVINKENQAFYQNFESLKPKIGISVSILQLSDSMGKTFSGELAKIAIYHKNAKTTFVQDETTERLIFKK